MENEIENSKIVFLFGAGAELAFGLPSGEKYIKKTILNKREDMYSVLGEFYKNRKGDYVKSYAGQYLFKRNSHTFREMIENAARKIEDNECDGETKKYMELLKEYEKLKKDTEEAEQCKEKLKKLKQLEQDIYDAIVIKKNEQDYKALKEHLSYYGVVEKDFATILAPEEAGPHRFWRLINYFWSAFFTIFLPLCERSQLSWFLDANGDEQKQYESILENFPERIVNVLNEYDYSEFDNCMKNYYSIIRKQYKKSYALTTNYTPFVEHYFGEQAIYLAGKLYEFEYPTKLLVKDVRSEWKEEDEDNCFVFPFLMTQAPIKPIITPTQIGEYKRAIDELEKAKVLVVIGYSLGEADDHINAILRDYIMKNTEKRLIYCAFSEKDFNEEKERNNVIKKLKLPEYKSERIIIIHNKGNANDLLEEIQKRICLLVDS